MAFTFKSRFANVVIILSSRISTVMSKTITQYGVDWYRYSQTHSVWPVFTMLLLVNIFLKLWMIKNSDSTGQLYHCRFVSFPKPETIRNH